MKAITTQECMTEQDILSEQPRPSPYSVCANCANNSMTSVGMAMRHVILVDGLLHGCYLPEIPTHFIPMIFQKSTQIETYYLSHKADFNIVLYRIAFP